VVGWKDERILPGPGKVFPRCDLAEAAGGDRTTMRALWGFFSRWSSVRSSVRWPDRVLRAAGSLITGLQTMPSIVCSRRTGAVRLSEGAIVRRGARAAPSIANGLISGVDHVPPILLRAGRVLGAKGFELFRSVTLPAAMPTYVSGLKQGWAFAWRSLMAGELIVLLGKPTLGARLQFARELSDYPLLIAYMIVILVIGIVIDSVFGAVEHRIRAKRGLLVTS
jgi:NitT/TauT family transport system permease protein